MNPIPAPDPARPTRRAVMGAGAITAAALAVGCTKVTPSQAIAVSTEEVRYGDVSTQTGELRVPLEPTPRPLVVLIHGGYWSQGFTRAAMVPISDDLTRLGYATWNVDYRTIEDEGGGWPGTADDVARGIDFLPELAETRKLDLDKVVFLGHSAGAQLMMWAAARNGSDGRTAAYLRPKALVSLSGVLDLELAAQRGEGELATLGESTVALMDGTPAQQPVRYREANPMNLLSLGLPMLLMHGSKDRKVPPEHSRRFAAAATNAGDNPILIELPNADHFDVIRPTKAWWDEVLRWLPTIVGQPLG